MKVERVGVDVGQTGQLSRSVERRARRHADAFPTVGAIRFSRYTRGMSRSLYESLRIKSPCEEDADAMVLSADGRTRHCGTCRRDIVHFAVLTHAEVEQLFRDRTGTMCGLVERREDGAIRLADGYVHPPRIVTNRRLPLLAAATLSLAACSTAAPTPSQTEAIDATPHIAAHETLAAGDAGRIATEEGACDADARDAEAGVDSGDAGTMQAKRTTKAKPRPATEPLWMGFL